MYIPPYFVETDHKRIEHVLDRHGFADLISIHERCLFASHIPMLRARATDGDNWILSGHLAANNPQLASLFDGQTVLAIFKGEHKYVSPRFYVNPGVPTWNYLAVHLYGRANRIEGRDAVLDHLAEMTRKYEAEANGWSLVELDTARLDKLSGAIVAFRIHVDRIEAKFKLSQNRSIDDQHTVIAHFEAQDNPNADALAQLMRENLKRSGS